MSESPTPRPSRPLPPVAIVIGVLFFFGLLGLMVRRFGLPVLPLILGVILGPLMEEKFREALSLSDGAWSGLLAEPLGIGVYVLIGVLVVLPPLLKRRAAARGTTPPDPTRPSDPTDPTDPTDRDEERVSR